MPRAKDYKDGYYAALDSLPIAVTIMRIIVNDDNIPEDIVMEYVNSRFAQLYDKNKEDILGHKFTEVFDGDKQRYLYMVWNTACNGIKNELSFYDSNAKKHLFCRYFQVEYGLCGCIVDDNSVNQKLKDMFDDMQRAANK